MMKTLLVSVALVALPACVAPVDATPRRERDAMQERRAPYPVYSTRARAEGPVCRPWCAHDYNPCDPPSFKIADGRCDFDNN